jgi:hypothetical protein
MEHVYRTPTNTDRGSPAGLMRQAGATDQEAHEAAVAAVGHGDYPEL